MGCGYLPSIGKNLPGGEPVDRKTGARAGALALAGMVVLAGCSGAGDGAKAHADATAPAGGSAQQLQQQYEKVVESVLPSVVKIPTRARAPVSSTTARATS
jgi:hypothetical protein